MASESSHLSFRRREAVPRVDSDDDGDEAATNQLTPEYQPAPITFRRMVARILWPRRRWLWFFAKLFLVVGLFSFILYAFIVVPVRHYFWETNHAARFTFLRHDRCPACFGQSMCPVLRGGAIELKGMYKYPIFESYNVRNVIHGTWHRGIHRDEPIVMKKLGRTVYLRGVDHGLCFAVPGRDRNCKPSGALWSQLSPDGDEQVSLALVRESQTDLATCMSERLLHKMKQSFRERNTGRGVDLILRHDQLVLLYTMRVNPEPLLLQTFPYDRQLWPFFPRYHGACGQWVVIEDRGQTMAAFVKTASLADRVFLAVQLLEMAKDLTDGRDDFTFYLGDANWENIVVDEAARVALIDLSNVLVIDRQETRHHTGHKKMYKAPFDPCPPENITQCFVTWDIERLCGVEESDYNFYSICRNFLSPSHANEHRIGGLLPDLAPHHVMSGVDVKELLDRCSRPGEHESRRSIAMKAQTLLREIHKKLSTTV